MRADNTRIKKLADYLIKQFREIKSVNANMLSKNINNYSLDKIPTSSVVEKWVTGDELHKDVYSFRSRNEYSTDAVNNMINVGFFEEFESIIRANNEQGVLPNIEGIQSIECLNCGTMNNTNTNTCEFDIQIQITYRI